ncbi:MAG: sugar phosphate isomerase/epimerase [Bryobacterales bacterium]|nr:sugar phosphate isomerase/epimerase [Bryobacterales bacterium]
MRIHRRHFIQTAALSAAVTWNRAQAEEPALKVGGIPLGLQTFCFNDRPFEQMIEAVVATGARGIELFRGHAEPQPLHRDRPKLREWRLTVDLRHFHDLRQKIHNAGLTILSYDVSMRSDWTEDEIDRAFQMARSLGTDLITTSSNIAVSPRLDAAAQKHSIRVGLHNHAQQKPDELATAEDYATALKGRSKWMGITFDTGHFAAAGFDCVPFLEANRERTFALHFKDRKKDMGPQVPLGTGDAGLPGIIAFLRRHNLTIPVCIEHVVQEGDRLPVIRNDVAWLRRELSKGL